MHDRLLLNVVMPLSEGNGCMSAHIWYVVSAATHSKVCNAGEAIMSICC